MLTGLATWLERHPHEVLEDSVCGQWCPSLSANTEESEDSEEGTSCQAQGAVGTAQGILQRHEQLPSPLPPSGCQAPLQDRIPALTPTTTRVHANPSQPGAEATTARMLSQNLAVKIPLNCGLKRNQLFQIVMKHSTRSVTREEYAGLHFRRDRMKLGLAGISGFRTRAPH